MINLDHAQCGSKGGKAGTAGFLPTLICVFDAPNVSGLDCPSPENLIAGL
jgi:hypothetical protein